jgi:hypothetical protein
MTEPNSAPPFSRCYLCDYTYIYHAGRRSPLLPGDGGKGGKLRRVFHAFHRALLFPCVFFIVDYYELLKAFQGLF